MNENSPTSQPHEKLRHSPGEVVIGLTRSLGGKDCVGMTFDNKEWSLLTVRQGPMADQFRKVIQKQFAVDSIPGMPFNWRTSLSERKLKLEDRAGVIGIYVPADKFDDLVENMSGL